MIVEIDERRRAQDLRLLFYPTREDYWTGTSRRGGGALKWPLHADYQSRVQLPNGEVGKKPIMVDGKGYSTRRPNFLPALSNSKYRKTFKTLLSNPQLRCPTWYVSNLT
jgi:hypothetical protein